MHHIYSIYSLSFMLQVSSLVERLNPVAVFNKWISQLDLSIKCNKVLLAFENGQVFVCGVEVM